MNEWHVLKIEDIAEIKNGSTPSTKDGENYNGDIVWITPNDISKQKVRYIYEGERNITRKGYDSCSNTLLPIGSILLSSRAPIGLLAIYKVELCTNQGFKNLIPKENIDSLFLYYLLKIKIKEIENLGTGTTFKEVSKTTLESYRLKIPRAVYLQQKIASILSTLDDKIELNNKINAELEAIAKTIYDYWFVQFDFPDANGKPYRSSGGAMVYNEILKREIPEGWIDHKIEDLGKIVGGSTPSKAISENFSSNGTPWITPRDLSLNINNKFITKGELDVSEKGIKEASLRILPENSVLMSSRAPVGYLAINRLCCTTNQGFKSIICNKNFSSEYVYYVLMSNMHSIEANATGSTFKEISGSVFRSLSIVKPKDTLIERFVESAKSIFLKQNNLEKQNQELASLRDWLLPMLMNEQVGFKEEKE